ncbi:hypothetical protein LXA43DRAFT_851647, partial [Ganoderma leucocontextum]
SEAQVRHRAKRKAYVQHLEETVAKLQSVLALSPDQVTAIPPPLTRMKELEQKNQLLRQEVDVLRRQLEAKRTQLPVRLDTNAYAPLLDHRHFNDEALRRRTADTNALYVV